MHYCHTDSPLGPLLLAGEGETLHVIGFPEGPKAMQANPAWSRDDTAFAEARRQLAEYFDGSRQAFDLSLAPRGTEFQLAVWEALRQIPYGATCSYQDIAERIGRPTAVRAVGAANGRNPLPIVVPCHRVIGRNGSLTGFGGGLPAKQFLLGLESQGSFRLSN